LRRNRAVQKANTAQAMLDSGMAQRKLQRLSAKVDEADSRNQAARTLLAVASSETLDERFATLEQNDQIEALLLELKERQPQLADHS
jgi:phage shock protein A